MGNITDYIAWRGDISFKTRSFNHIDSLVLCQILYAELDSIVSSSFTSKTPLPVIAEKYLNQNLHEKDLGALINNETGRFLDLVSKTKRFSQLELCGFENIIDLKEEVQFAAITALLPNGELCVVFRGTDDTLIGWKEDFNMSHTFPVPSQKLALDYLEKVCAKFNKKTIVMGHSKGGNLAVYATAFCNTKASKKIHTVYDNDGPGFLPNVYNQDNFIKNAKRVYSVIPESSIVGSLLKRVNKAVYIESSEKSGIRQHDIFSWQLLGTDCIIAQKQNQASELFAKTVETWLNDVDVEDRKRFIHELFAVIETTSASTLLELTNNWLHCSVAVLKSMNELDKKTKERIYKIVIILFNAIKVNLPPIKDFLTHA